MLIISANQSSVPFHRASGVGNIIDYGFIEVAFYVSNIFWYGFVNEGKKQILEDVVRLCLIFELRADNRSNKSAVLGKYYVCLVHTIYTTTGISA
jgi:crotonobetainyl-CoA:carnitine CoA-transferase CaiB-like acyl-CoA transferase